MLMNKILDIDLLISFVISKINYFLLISKRVRLDKYFGGQDEENIFAHNSASKRHGKQEKNVVFGETKGLNTLPP